ncbi:MAG: hypothetical protein QG657_759 [Acidobacteriota bacterium]|nr:hypothetical protein [Acidobacteriota bacterium]
MNNFVGIMVEDSPQLLVGLLGILKSGKALVPISATYPSERIHFIIKDCNIRLLLTDKANYGKSYEIAAASPVLTHLLCLDDGTSDTFDKKTGEAHSSFQKEETCYVIYTSGSTGKPKGVPITYRNLNPLFYYSREYLHLGGHTRVMKNLSYTFDFGIFEILTTLLFGGQLYILNKSSIGDFSFYAYFINRQQINTLHTTPVFLNNLACSGQKMPFIKRIHLGGEQLTGKVVQDTLAVISPGCILYNGYGPTEASINCTFFSLTWEEMKANVRENIPIGKPCDRHEIYILDNFLNPQPVGAAGELCIAGPGLSKGYLNRPELTAEKFGPQITLITQINVIKKTKIIKSFTGVRTGGAVFQKSPLEIYRTGDLARWSTDGNIDFLGRIDHQVKIRGFRIELGEIESCLSLHPMVKETVIMAREYENGDNYLCAYIVTQPPEHLTVSQLREFLSKHLPDYMIPAYFIQVDRIPMTTNGKIDRKALPKPDETFIDTGVEYVAPVTGTEKKLTLFWQQLLMIEKIGIVDDFFHLGGDSILVNRCIARIREEMQVEIPLRKFFEQPFIKALAEEIEKQERRVFSIPKAARDGDIPLSFPQERLWFLQNLNSESVAYFVPRVIRVIGKLEVKILERTFTEIIRRHEILRTVFVTKDSIPVQQVQAPYYFNIPVIDISRDEVEHWVEEEGHKSFDFDKGPLLRVSLLKLEENEQLIVLTEHHLVHDGWTQGVLLKEFIHIFTAYSEGRDHDLPELPIQYADFCVWQREFLQGERLNRHLDYWKEKLSDLIPLLELPGDRPRPTVMSGNGALKEFRLPCTLTRQLEEFSRENGITLFMTMLAVFNTLLYRYSREEDLCVGMGIANRGYKEMEGMLGMVINTLPLRTHTVGDLTFTQYLNRVKETCLEAYQHQDTPFGKIVEALAPKRSLSYNPLFQVMFNFMDTPTEDLWLPGLELHLEPTHNRSAKFDINIVVVPPPEQEIDPASEINGGEILVEWEYNVDIFDDETIVRMINHYIRLLEESLGRPDVCISTLPMLDLGEINRLLIEWNDTAVDYPREKTIHQLFAEQAARTPDRIAIFSHGRTRTNTDNNITYKKLDVQSNRLAHLLIEKGVLADNIIGIMAERSIDLVIDIMGILKAGGAYLPIDPSYPQDRIDYMLADSAVKILIIKSEIRISKYETNPNDQKINIQNKNVEDLMVLDFEHLDFEFVSNFEYRASNLLPANLAYIIYTSGSTGKPKGVTVEHGSAVNLLYSLQNEYPFVESDTYLLKTSYTFDVSVTELFGWYMGGGKLAILEKNGEKDPQVIFDWIERYFVTHINFVPPMFNAFATQLDSKHIKRLSSLKYIFLAGEALLPEFVKNFRSLNTSVRLENIYGPTENSVYSSKYSLADWSESRSVPIGRPLPNIKLFILNKYNYLQAIGISGELCISGLGLARGYLNRPELTAEKFEQDLWAEQDNQDDRNKSFCGGDRGAVFSKKAPLLYRTGDLARWLPDGNIEFLGRLDNQVKIRGFRVELGEIENLLRKHIGIKGTVAAVLKGDETGDKSLAAYFVSDIELSETQLREYLLKNLPDYMIPSYFVRLEKIPLTPTGKVDRKALRGPIVKEIADYAAPREEKEMKLVEIWAEILGRDISQNRIGIDGNFFQLGGHSLKAISLASRIYKEFNVKIPLGEIFKRPTIRGLFDYIKGAAGELYIRIEAAEKKEYYVLSSAQKRLHFLQQMDNTGTAYNISAAWILEGIVEKDRLEQSIVKLIQRHDSLRTSLQVIEDHPVQRIQENVEFKIEILSGRGEEILKTFIRPFYLSKAPLLRVGLVKLAENKHLLMADMHHIISDGMSMQILVQDFSAFYMGKELPEIKLHYKDYAEWQNRERSSKKILEQSEYWKKEFEGEIPVLELPTDYARPVVQAFAGNRINFELNSETSCALKSMALEAEATLFIVLKALYAIFLAKLSGQEDIIIGSPAAGRRHHDIEMIMGLFVNTLALRSYPRGEKQFMEFLGEVKESIIKAFENQEYQYEDLVERVSINRATGRNPLFDAMFVLQNTGSEKIAIPGLQLIPYEYENKTSKFDLTLIVVEVEEKLHLTFEYSTKLFKWETIERFSDYFNNVVKGVIENKEQRIFAVGIITEKEKRLILCDFNNAERDYPKDKTIHGLFEEQVEKAPDRIALVGAGPRVCPGLVRTIGIVRTVSLTYRQLNEQSDRLAGLLIEKGVLADNIVGNIAERSFEMIVGILGILKSGGAYLPIDPGYPGERIDYMLKDSGAKLLVTTSDKKGEISCIDELPVSSYPLTLLPSHLPTSLPPYLLNSSSLAYVIYTSGSTGTPKGVLVDHGNVVRLVKNPNFIEHKEGQRLLLTGAFMFDIVTFEIWWPLLNGLSLYLTDKSTVLDPIKIEKMISLNRIDILHLVPQLFKQLFSQDPSIFAELSCFLVGGDLVPPQDIRRLRSKYEKLKILHMYGPTEGTTFSTYLDVDKVGENDRALPIGVPVNNSLIYILGKYNELLPIGVVGQLCIGGAGVARGYLNNPELTAEKFGTRINNNFTWGCTGGTVFQKSPLVIYRTGDLACWLADGNIEFLGRMDQQIKIRGMRIEPGEIENQLLKHKEIKEAVLQAMEDTGEDKSLTAYIVSTGELPESELRQYLQKELPDYMIPSYFVFLEKIPLTANGKIDRGALPKPGLKIGRNYTAPRNDIEKKLLEIWSEILGRDELHVSQLQASTGIDDNFFQLGGHSLKATSLASRINKEFDIKIPLGEIFKYPTIRGLFTYLKRSVNEDYTRVEVAEKKEYYKLSSAQKRLYFLQQMDNAGTAYNISAAWLLEGIIDKAGLEQTIIKLIRRHDSLRTSFEVREGEPVQRIHEQVEFEIEILGAREQQVGISRRDPAWSSNQVFIRPFDLARAPLLHVGLMRLEEEKHLLIMDMHHIITDGTSAQVLVQDFSAFYAGKELPGINLQYKDYTEWQNREKKSKNILEQGEHWKKEFEGEIPILELPTDYSRPDVQVFEGNRINFEINSETSGTLKVLAMETGSTLYIVLLALYAIFLSKLSNQEDIIIGSPTAGRKHNDLEKIIGMFVNTLALRNQPVGEKDFRDFLGEVKKTALKGFENQEYQYEDLLEQIPVNRNPGRNPLFDTMFVLQNIGFQKIEIPGLKLVPYEFENKTSKFDLLLTGVEVEMKLLFAFEYSTKLFKRETIERFITFFVNIIQGAIENSREKISDLEIITEEEKHSLLYDFNNIETEYPKEKTIHRLFEEQVEISADRIAVIGPTIVEALHTASLHITYRKLNNQSDRLAGTLIEKGIRADNMVGILLERSVEMITGIMAILKSGGAYLPIDPGYPQERINYMLKDSNAKILLNKSEIRNPKLETNPNDKNLNDQNRNFGVPFVLNLDNLDFEFVSSFDMRISNLNSSNLAYIIYTSGTTGKPKGVAIEHHSLVNRLTWMQKIYPLNANDTLLQKTAYTFDVSVWEIFWWSIVGARLRLLVPGGEKDPKLITQEIERNHITTMHFVPSMLGVFLDYLQGSRELKKLSVLKQVIASGEALLPVHVKRFNEILNKSNGTVLANLYGPTEATVDVSYFNCTPPIKSYTIPIGKPIDNIHLIILNRYLGLQPIGITGELCIAGVGLARGYLNRPELTAEKFIEIHHSSFIIHHSKFYRTGDLARWLPDGNIEFLGRIDHQVKIRGFRIELEEIENQLLKHNHIKQAQTLVRTNEKKDNFICAYITADKQLEITDLRKYLSGHLPEYMIPSHFVQVEKIPLTPNGKVDRKALAAYGTWLDVGTSYEAPQNDTQEKIIEIWKQVLERDKIGIYDNYFDLGGVSFDILRINKLLNDTFQIEITIPEMFRFTTVYSMEQFLNDKIEERRSRAEILKKGKMDKMQQLQKRKKTREK